MNCGINSALEELSRLLGPKGFFRGAEVPRRNWGDASTVAPVLPLALLRPGSTREVAAVMRICTRYKLPVTVQGGLTGLCGGAVPEDGGVALSLERMNRVEKVDVVSMSISVEAGTPLETVQRAASEAGFICPVDLGARGSCTIGGNVSTNAGGNRVLRYGMMRQAVLGLEAVLADGTVVSRMGTMLKDNAGYDLKQLFIGSEGTLAIVTRAVLALSPKPQWTGVAMVGVRDFDAAMRSLYSARQILGPALSAFEVMWPDYWKMVTKELQQRSDPFDHSHGFYFLIEASGSSEERDGRAFVDFLERSFEEGLIEDAVVARSSAEMADLWAIRDSSAEIEPLLGAHESFDVSMSPGLLGAFVDEARRVILDTCRDSKVVFFGHAADGNIHIMASVPDGFPNDREKIEDVIYTLVKRYEGSVSAEHGIGSLKRQWLSHSRSDAEIVLMRKLKGLLDPANLLNPGKVLPDS